MKFTEFLKSKGATSSIFMGIFYAICMLGIFLPGYTSIPKNIDQLPIAIVNDDAGQFGEQIEESLAGQLPFDNIKTDVTNKEAMQELEDNDLVLVIHIPKTFSSELQNNEGPSSIDFTLNEAGATVVSSTMNQVVSQINSQLQQQFSQQTAEGVLMNFNVPEEQAKELAEKIENSYVGNVVTINDIPNGMHNNMLPMFLTMALYVGAMIAAMQLVGAFRANRNKATKTRLFIYVQLTAILIGVIAGLVSTGVAFGINDLSSDLFLQVWGQQILNYWVCFNFTAIVVFLIGEAGMVLNIPILLVQTIANGATISRDMMYTPYEWASHITPMYYSVQAYFANLFGSTNVSPFLMRLAAVGLVAMLINIIIVWLFHKPVHNAKNQATATPIG
ncbi:YhgE/Pip domain-containing protein [Sporosarcina sp. Te-1]|uniref:YhgE/Pip domain-containing protein n=1 Tax=Sporosarcina sp. Te-1 TaxID=2818390 RepID=UPI001A9FD4F6|nr:ABC transporter permease [Sporosarcina sp. Te-1]QTD41832.1 ABC transporter permease [Sporosarcina sp. Te-1]